VRTVPRPIDAHIVGRIPLDGPERLSSPVRCPWASASASAGWAAADEILDMHSMVADAITTG
jgi:hypothetical protein